MCGVEGRPTTPVVSASYHEWAVPPPQDAVAGGEEMSEPIDSLTPREREVLQLVAGGLTNEAIAGALVISKDTVQTHMSHILAKHESHEL